MAPTKISSVRFRPVCQASAGVCDCRSQRKLMSDRLRNRMTTRLALTNGVPEVMCSKKHRLHSGLLVARGMSVIRADSFGRCHLICVKLCQESELCTPIIGCYWI